MPIIGLDGVNPKTNTATGWTDHFLNRASTIVGTTLAVFTDSARVSAKGASAQCGRDLDGVDDSVQLQSFPVTGINSTANITFDLWFRVGSTAETVLFGNRAAASPAISTQNGWVAGLSFSPDGATAWLGIQYRANGGNASGITFDDIPNLFNTDTNLVITFERNADPNLRGRYSLYRNGAFVTAGNATGGSAFPLTSNNNGLTRVGGSRFSPFRYMNGTIYRFATFNKGLTADEVAENYRINSRKYGF